MAKSNKIETKDLRDKLLENLDKLTKITKKVNWNNYQKAFNSMDDYVWIRISPKVHFAQPMGFSTRENNRGRGGAYQVYVNPNIPKQFQVPVEMHEWGHILYTHLTLPKVQRSILIKKIRSFWPEIKLHLSDEVLNKAINDPEYGDYICERLSNCILNIAMDFEVNSKLFEEFEKDDLIQYLSIAGCYSLAYATESSIEGLERALRWTEYQLGIRVPKKGNKVTPLFMPCLPEDLGMPRGLEFEKYIDYILIHDDEFFQYARNSLSKSTGLSGQPNTPQNQNNEDSGDEIDENDSNSGSISDSSDYGKEDSSNNFSESQEQGAGQGSQGQSSNRPQLPELATEKFEHTFDKDGGGMEDWNPSNDEKNAQQQQQQQQQNQQQNGSNGSQQNNPQNNSQGNSGDSGSEDNGSNEDTQNIPQENSEDTNSEQQPNESNDENGNNPLNESNESSQSGSGQSDSNQSESTDTNNNNQIGSGEGNETEQGEPTNNKDSLGRDIDDSHVDEDEMDANSTSSGNPDVSDFLNNDNNDESNSSSSNSQSGDSDDSSNNNKGNGNNKGNVKLSPDEINNLIQAYIDGDMEQNQEVVDKSENESGSSSSAYSPVGSANSQARVTERDDIIELGRTDKLEKFIVQCCFNKQHTDTRVDSMYYYNRRKFNSNRIIPKKRQENRYRPGDVYVLIDVSGSVNEQAVSTIIQTITKVANKCGHKSRAIFWDTELCGDFQLNKIGSIHCGGGTFMADGMKYIRENYLKHNNDKLIVVSDFCDSLYHWDEQVKQFKGDVFGVCWTDGLNPDFTSVKDYIEDISFGSDDFSIIDTLLKEMPTILVDIS